jgi:hypothetical protein
LRTLARDWFDLTTDPPTVTVLACYAKNGREANQRLSAAMAELLAPWLASKAPGEPIFGDLTDRTAEMIRVDLQAAGIPYGTPAGVVDFHALRAAYVSHLVASGASVKTCQVLARHSTPSLAIGLFAKASLHDIKGAVESLPDLTPSAPETEALAATGTDGVSAPRATESATVLPVDATQPQAGQLLTVGSATDLKSSGGEPPCGFDSHHRYSFQRL